MAPNPEHTGNSADNGRSEQDETVQERVRELTWALLDQYASDDDLQLLDNLLLSDEGARKAYIGCVQLHSDLFGHFAPRAESAASEPISRTTVLELIDNTLPMIGGASPVVEE